jgi:hypothetical protein
MTRTLAATVLAAALLLCPASARADVVLEWNAIMQATVASQNPFAQARFAAITQLAVFEAVNAITGDYTPYLGTVAAPAGASVDAAAATAAYRVLLRYFPTSATTLNAAYANSLAAIPDGQAKSEGITAGEAAATAMIALRAADGSAPPQFYAPTSSDPGQWSRTQGCPPGGGILLHWRNVRPFGIESSAQFRSEPPPSLTSDKYTEDFNEVRRVGGVNSGSRPVDRADMAWFYNAVLAVATWNQAVRQVAAVDGTSLSENARAFALLNMAISDGLVTVMETKYYYTFWRPETAIPAGDTDGNPKTEADFNFVPFIATPCFPGYPSAHATASYAARKIAERIFGARQHSITLSSPAVPGVTLHYSSFREITQDIDDARVFGGIHFRFDQDAGAKQGRHLGAFVYRNNLRPEGGGTR